MVADRDQKIFIQSEDDAWKAIEAAFQGKLDASQLGISLVGWPNLHVHIEGREAAITASMMEAYVELQKAIYRSYALIKYDDADARYLTDDDRAKLELEVRVSEGSSNYDVSLQDVLIQVAGQVVDKMDATQLTVLALGFGVIFSSKALISQYLQNKADIRQREAASQDTKNALEALKSNSDNELKRTEMLSEILKMHPRLVVVKDEADGARDALLRGFADEGEVEFQGIQLDGEIASELLKRDRKASKKVTITGDFSIQRVDTTSPEGFRVLLKNNETGETLLAGVNHVLLSDEQRKVIQHAEWEKALIRVKIEAFKTGSNYTRASIKEVSKIDENEVE